MVRYPTDPKLEYNLARLDHDELLGMVYNIFSDVVIKFDLEKSIQDKEFLTKCSQDYDRRKMIILNMIEEIRPGFTQECKDILEQEREDYLANMPFSD